MLPKVDQELVQKQYQDAKSVFSSFGSDAELAMQRLAEIPVSLHCWQGDDVGGFESQAGLTGGGIQATGNYPGKPRTAVELREDISKALGLLPGKLKLNLHAIYGDFDGKSVGRDQIGPEYFTKWMSWAKSEGIGLDFNPTFFSHPLADDGFTLASPDKERRSFWIRHGIACREIGAAFGKELGIACINNIWIPDGYKDRPADRLTPRKHLKDSLDAILEKQIDPGLNRDAVEAKLFGIASESYVVGSHEFYLAYALLNPRVMLCLDTGHFHPTESVADKLSSVLTFEDELLLHVSRPVRWDSDHVVTVNDELRATTEEIKRCDAFDRIYIALDFFDASINRLAAWIVGTRATQKMLLAALLEPTDLLQAEELAGNLTNRLALMEEIKALPVGAIWDKYCLDHNVPVAWDWIRDMWDYEEQVFSKRK